ncbi:MAG: aminotransferase class V-fold PLP-dependent enzyme [Thioclava sp.]|nr:aminotransferase class V-fold PLP-dependent enzyme [Thioclava sp.]MBD3802656.1 aminotransferase class V-fold PLP-dependent enzyme [Thioclava sp.]
MERTYLDWNATTPLRVEAREAMIAAMDVVGNPSSVHSEGRAAKALVERARAQVAAALGAEGQDIIFTSGATEAAALALAGQGMHCAGVEHDAVRSWCEQDLGVDRTGRIEVFDPAHSAVQLANSETGVVQELPEGLYLSDLTQGFGKIPFAFNWLGVTCGIVSAHKLGGPKGIGALVVKRGTDIAAQLKGGGQEMGRRAGTENLTGIAGFGAAAEAASHDLESGIWARVEIVRNILESAIADRAKETIFVGNESRRLPNTTCFITPGWKGETQVMQMDLGGFAVSAGSACSSGKVKSSAALVAMGFSEEEAGCALRVSIGPDTREEDVMRFAEHWLKCEGKHRARRG